MAIIKYPQILNQSISSVYILAQKHKYLQACFQDLFFKDR